MTLISKFYDASVKLDKVYGFEGSIYGLEYLASVDKFSVNLRYLAKISAPILVLLPTPLEIAYHIGTLSDFINVNGLFYHSPSVYDSGISHEYAGTFLELSNGSFIVPHGKVDLILNSYVAGVKE